MHALRLFYGLYPLCDLTILYLRSILKKEKKTRTQCFDINNGSLEQFAPHEQMHHIP